MAYNDLIKELEYWSKKHHAEVVYAKCVKNGKLKLAMKIAFKYNIQPEDKNDDVVFALGLALIAQTTYEEAGG